MYRTEWDGRRLLASDRPGGDPNGPAEAGRPFDQEPRRNEYITMRCSPSAFSWAPST